MRIKDPQAQGKLPCNSATVSNEPNPLKNASPKKPNGFAKKPSWFHPALYARNSSAKPDTPKQPLI
jgi:hypothetical protein